MSVPEGRFQKPQLFLHPDCEKHHIWWCSKMWFGPVKLLRKVTNPWAARLTRSRSVRCSAPTDHELDRKSTRLNSSHGYISYAVFCLKKKKRPAPHQIPSIILSLNMRTD